MPPRWGVALTLYPHRQQQFAPERRSVRNQRLRTSDRGVRRDGLRQFRVGLARGVEASAQDRGPEPWLRLCQIRGFGFFPASSPCSGALSEQRHQRNAEARGADARIAASVRSNALASTLAIAAAISCCAARTRSVALRWVSRPREVRPTPVPRRSISPWASRSSSNSAISANVRLSRRASSRAANGSGPSATSLTPAKEAARRRAPVSPHSRPP